MKNYVDSAGLQEYTDKLIPKLKTIFPGAPLKAATAAAMTDTSKVYVYTGNETGYVYGDWYTWNGTEWEDCGVYNALAVETDPTLLVPGMPADAKVTGDDIADLKNAIGAPAQMAEYYGYISSGAWVSTTSGKVLIIPVKAGQSISIKSHATNTSPIAMLKDFDPTNGATINYSDVSGWTTAYSIPANTVFTGTVPSDANYLYVYCGTSSGNYTNRIPESIVIDGYDFRKSVEDNILLVRNENKNDITNLERIIGNPCEMEAYFGYISSGAWLATDTSKTLIIPIKPGQNLKIKANANDTSPIAILKNFTPINGETIDYSEDSNWNSAKVITTNTILEGIVPDDGQYLYVYCGLRSQDYTNRLPQIISINGYDYLKTVAENIVGNENDIANLENIIGTPCEIEYYLGYISSGAWLATNIGKTLIIPVKPGQNLIIKANANDTSNIAILKSFSPINGETIHYSDSNEWNSVKTISADTVFGGMVPDDGQYLYVYCGLASQDYKNRLPQIISINGYDYLKTVAENIGDKEKEITPLRIMQYNCGKFNMGEQTQGLPPEIYDEKVKNYKKFFSDAKADIIGIEEYIANLNRGDDVETPIINTANELFKPLYKTTYSSVGWALGCYSNYERTYGNTGSVTIYPGTAEEYQKGYLLNRFDVKGRQVAIMVTALNSHANQESADKRKEELAALLDLMKDYDYAFVVLDMNNNGNEAIATAPINNSIIEGEELLDYVHTLTPEGESWTWEFAMGSYFPFMQTYSDVNRVNDQGVSVQRQAYSPCIDNVIYKNNGLTRFKDFTIFNDFVEDTWWVPLEPTGGFQPGDYHGSTYPQYRCVGEWMEIRGTRRGIGPLSAGVQDPAPVIGVLPNHAKPIEETTLSVYIETGTGANYHVVSGTAKAKTNGEIVLYSIPEDVSGTCDIALNYCPLFRVKNTLRQLYSDHFPVYADFELL